MADLTTKMQYNPETKPGASAVSMRAKLDQLKQSSPTLKDTLPNASVAPILPAAPRVTPPLPPQPIQAPRRIENKPAPVESKPAEVENIQLPLQPEVPLQPERARPIQPAPRAPSPVPTSPTPAPVAQPTVESKPTSEPKKITAITGFLKKNKIGIAGVHEAQSLLNELRG